MKWHPIALQAASLADELMDAGQEKAARVLNACACAINRQCELLAAAELGLLDPQRAKRAQLASKLIAGRHEIEELLGMTLITSPPPD